MGEPRREAFVTEAELELGPSTAPEAVGAAVTAALCGHWQHEGPCRWPNNNDYEDAGRTITFRTLFVAPPEEESEIRGRIERALRQNTAWTVRWLRPRGVAPRERDLATRLARTPRRAVGG